MPGSDIVIKGAREHNLRGVDVVLPRNQLICLTGVSGSGKSSLAFDTVYAEGQRRYVESLSSFARQFLGQMPKPDVDYIGGLSPSISISQKSAGHNPRSTVGTITEIYDYLRVLFARVGDGHCPRCKQAITAQSREQIIQRILTLESGTKVAVLAPVIRGQKGEYRDLFEDFLKQGFVRARVDGEIVSLTSDPKLDRQMRHDIEIVIDRLTIQPSVRARLSEAVDLALKVGKGNLIVNHELDDSTDATKTDASAERPARRSSKRKRSSSQRRPRSSQGGGHDFVLSSDYACTDCGLSFDPPSPQLFSFNSPQGMCLECDGLGEVFSFDVDRLIPNPRLSFKQGCFDLIGPWKQLGRWKRHIYQGVAETMERVLEVPKGTLLETPWALLESSLQNIWLWGTGDRHITFTWRSGSSPLKYGGRFEGIIPELQDKYRTSNSKIQIRKLEQYMTTMECPDCGGQRLNRQARSMTIRTANKSFADNASRSLPEICQFTVSDALKFFEALSLDETRMIVANEALKEIRGRLGFLSNVGLDYLSLDRTAPTLSGGESQRIRLAGQIGCGLVGVLYILDEPSIGLHPRDNDRLINTLCDLRDLGNTVVVVEHDEDTMRASDHLIDFGPGPGVRGGELVAAGSIAQLINTKKSVTGQYLAGKRSIAVPQTRRMADGAEPVVSEANAAGTRPKKRTVRRQLTAGVREPLKPGAAWLSVTGACHNNLKHIDVHIPLGAFVCLTGVSGSGKSSLVGDILVEALRRDLNHGDGHPGQFGQLLGLDALDKMIAIDQSPIGRTPRSNPGTYIKLFDDIRNLFAQLPLAKQRGYKPGRFSFNVDVGRCQACDGNGSTKLEMDFLADVWVTCPVCQGHRFNRETLNVQFKGHSIADVLEMDVQQALTLFDNIPKIHHKLQTLHDVGLDYLKIGQPSPTLSGGEAQRIKLARELVKKSTGRTLYTLDEPTTGLHFADIKMLLKVLHDFVDSGNTVIVVEHNLDVIKTADWIIDLGPEGGVGGGQIVASGTPEQIAACKQSHTGRALKHALRGETGTAVQKGQRRRGRGSRRGRIALAKRIEVEGARQHNLRGVDLKLPRDQMSVFCGPSGSGKSSLAMDTIYAEGQRRYVESLSSYARQFVNQMQKPQLERIEGLSPAIAIEQQNLGNTPRSTVGTTTEIYDYLRILMARLGTLYCPDCQIPVGTQTADQVVDKILREPEGTRLYLMAPVSVEVGRQYETLWSELQAAGYHRVRVDGQTHTLDAMPMIDRRRKHSVEVVIDRAIVRANARGRIAESVETALSMGNGVLHVAYPKPDVAESEWRVRSHSQHRVCEQCGRSFEALTPHSFSFNSHLGWCSACEGLGTESGANPAALIRSQQMTLAEGALLLWPNVHREVSQWMLQALSAGTNIPLDVPICELDARQRRRILHGTGDQWFPVYYGQTGTTSGRQQRKKQPTLFEFQFKGLYPALEEAARLSPALRYRLEHLVDEVECSACGGSRLREDSASVRFLDRTIDQLCRLPLGQLQRTVNQWKLTRPQQKIAGELIREIRNRTQFLNDVGLEYLTLHRTAATLSGGEAQRIRLASQLGSGLCGVLYVLDEPTIGLHPRDNQRLLTALHKLRDLGNTLVLVEHDREVIAGSDHIVDFGPGAGRHGGTVVAEGSPEKVSRRRASVTGPYLSGKKAIPVPRNRRIVDPSSVRQAHDAAVQSARATVADSETTKATHRTGRRSSPARNSNGSSHGNGNSQGSLPDVLTAINVQHHNLRNVSVSIPLGAFTAVTGVSGSGKSSLVNDVLYAELARTLHRASTVSGAHERLLGIEHINKVVRVDQQPLGNSPTSNPATFTGVFQLIRMLFAELPDARLRGYSPRRFSFNVPGGRCDECEGNGQRCIEMHFLPDVWVPCDACGGDRYNKDTLEVRFHGHSIADVLQMTCGDAFHLFDAFPRIRRIIQTLCDVGLDYLQLGQPAPTLSGGEAQRVKLAAELSRPDTGRTLYLLDEPTTGLHFEDLAKLLNVLNRLVDLGNTVVVIEHNLDVIKTADWVIDMGPEAGESGGHVTVCGTPEEVAAYAQEHCRAQPTKKPEAPPAASGRNGQRRKTRKKKDATASNPGVAGNDQTGLPSLTGIALVQPLKAGPFQEREIYDPSQHEGRRQSDLDIADVGKQAKMPWQVDGRRWHTQDCVGRHGEPCRWDGKILDEVERRIQQHDCFSATDWNARSVVEICGKTKSHGWFFHAITGETWLLKLKFRVAKNTFRKDELLDRFDLKPLNQMDELPVYGNEPRVRSKAVRGPWQEIEFRLHDWDEVDTPQFWQFLDQAIDGFRSVAEKVAENPEDLMPWKKLGQKWHFARRGFPLGKRPRWLIGVLQELVELLQDVAGSESEIFWSNQKLVHLYVAGSRWPWATIHTKRIHSVDLFLTGPKNLFGLGRIRNLGQSASLESTVESRDVMTLSFQTVDQVRDQALREFLLEHIEGVRRERVG